MDLTLPLLVTTLALAGSSTPPTSEPAEPSIDRGATPTIGASTACPADLNGDCLVNGADLAVVLADWGTGGGPGDLDGNGVVNGADMALLLGSWGPCFVGPDLVVSEITLPSGVNVGAPISGTFRLTNAGTDPVIGSFQNGLSLSIDGNPFGSGDDIPLGLVPVSLPSPLFPGQSATIPFTSTAIPLGASITQQKFFVCADLGGPPCGAICEGCETNNCRFEPIEIGSPDVAVIDLTYPGLNVAGSVVPVTAVLHNNGANTVCSTLTACIGVGSGIQCATVPFCIAPFSTASFTANVIAPASAPDCGAIDTYSVSACLNLADANGSNNCRNESLAIYEQVYDLHFWITSGDDAVGLGDCFSYVVHVKNEGTAPSPGCAKFITGITKDQGPGVWPAPSTLVFWTSPQVGALQPGEEKTYTVSFCIPTCCNIFIGQQWLKVEILYTQGPGCADQCGEGWGNNFHQEQIQITF